MNSMVLALATAAKAARQAATVKRMLTGCICRLEISVAWEMWLRGRSD